MTSTLSTIGQLTRRGDPQRIPVIVHHSLTGKSGAVKAFGYDRGSYGRGSKVLLGWTRSQINLAPYGESDNEKIIVASGKCNNAKEFEPFGAQLDLVSGPVNRIVCFFQHGFPSAVDFFPGHGGGWPSTDKASG